MSRAATAGLPYPAADEPVNRELLARLDELNPCSERWKILVLGLLVTVTLLPEPKGLSLEELTEPGPGPPAPAESERPNRAVLSGRLRTSAAGSGAGHSG